MKIIRDVTVRGKRRVTLELGPDEKLMSFLDDAHYKLGDPVGEVVAGHIITDASLAVWCSAGQRWEV